MKIIIKLTFGFLLLLALVNCSGNSSGNNSEEAQQDTLSEAQKAEQEIYDEVMSLHENLMKKMNDIYDLRKKLESKIDSLEKSGISTEIIKKRIADLEAGDKAMMDWMHNYSALPDSVPHDSVMNYYNDQKGKITHVKNSMMDALEKAQQYLDSIH